ncbi:unnamed protein product [Cylindrotheca closterium]|uniref:Uncharacterized protein n=1 Tax=Cylindrotheca closterium TaxID=2856 RepID=A0AAD2PY44_9STRA|nr:unnamed protein product [Cylindrotheca closterium]
MVLGGKKDESASPPYFVKWVAITLWIAMGIQWAFLQISSDGRASSSSSSSLPENIKITDSAPIILMGLPRSGSLAIHEYFECRGMTSRHYCCGDGDGDDNANDNDSNNSRKTSFPCPNQKTCGDCVLTNLKGNAKAFDGCHGGSGGNVGGVGGDADNGGSSIQVWSAFDVETDQGWFLPQHFALGLLQEQYPNAIWILNFRSNASDWAKSIYHWHSLTRRFLHSFGHLTEDQGIWDDLEPSSVSKPARTAQVTAEQVEEDLERSVARVLDTTKQQQRESKRDEILAILEEIYQKHTERIVNWGRQFPAHRLIEIQVDGDDVGSTIQSKLDKAFGVNYHQQSSQTECKFKFDPPDNDWQDFSLPY